MVRFAAALAERDSRRNASRLPPDGPGDRQLRPQPQVGQRVRGSRRQWPAAGLHDRLVWSTSTSVRPRGSFSRSLYGYVASEQFQPSEALDVTASGQTVRLSQHAAEAGGERSWRPTAKTANTSNVAANAIDGNPETFWHTRWGETNDPLPHHLVIDLGRPVSAPGHHLSAAAGHGQRPHSGGGDLLQPHAQGWGKPTAKAR